MDNPNDTAADNAELRRQVARLRTALNTVNDETGGCRTREADVAIYDAFGALAVIASETSVAA